MNDAQFAEYFQLLIRALTGLGLSLFALIARNHWRWPDD